MNASFREHVHLYCEGVLPEYAEPALFAELSVNSDLRTEMTELLKLQAAVKNHAASINPTPSTKNALFAELGLQMPTDRTAQQAAVGLIARNPRFFAASLSVLSSLATALILLFFFRSGWETNKSTTISGDYTPRQGLQNLAFQPNDQTLSPHDTVRETATIVRYVPVRQAATVIHTDVEEQSTLSSPPSPELEADSFPFTSKQPLYTSSDETFETTKLAITPATTPVRALSAESLPDTNAHFPMPTLRSANMENQETLPVRLSLRHALGVGQVGIHGGIHYALTKQHTIGFEGGTEGARLLVRNARSAEVRTVSEGEEAVFSGTAFYRYTFSGLAFPQFRSFAPFVQGGIGVIDKCGAVQGMVGIRFDVMPELSFTLAAEGKIPVFFVERHFQSKTALSIGIQYHISEK